MECKIAYYWHLSLIFQSFGFIVSLCYSFKLVEHIALYDIYAILWVINQVPICLFKESYGYF